ncbi:hypothetical protein UFOVP964_140 [uncultured Caudovirales phage]|uniref:Uncharacterized protein n=1 Tax=uncultured Caudovirales phage TaxID=2100421 RepID=A0A6J5Q966_9CAUD|nr:hypothetical protein UFOVP854_140 [uncultured Caudovirales phage]CAB4175255.1 hypothetical protein UFOVP964_140 [uncultured Caudovirales phage]CAB4178946.1 hypothetical protein UFOVP1034_18 [uncultured Caudovirales phage]CAB4189062.1 hypothetical protein UFOVP1177_18 [uncultured Caudovirales phage]CAB4192998.1 hypothetical protein UFOVP1243_5 [uncultured Caudovirales phage]
MKCANCTSDAVYTYSITPGYSIAYCKKDLPKFLDDRRKAGFLQTTAEYKAQLVEGQKSIAVQPTVVEEPLEEEPVIIEVVKPVKKAAKKKAV